MKQARVFLNGTFDPIPHYCNRKCFTLAADGGVQNAVRNGVTPDAILGDGDSFRIDDFPDIPYIAAPDQDSTDFEKCLSYLVENDFKTVDVFCFHGSRTDHMIAGLSVAARFKNAIHTRLFGGTSVSQVLPYAARITMPIETTVSLIPVPEAHGVSTDGLEWNLANTSLRLGVFESISNRSNQSEVEISYKSGNLFLILDRNVDYILQEQP